MGECWRGYFAWKEMLCSWVIPGRRSHIMGRLGPSDPSLVLPRASSFLSDLHHVSRGTPTWCAGFYPSWEVNPNHHEDFAPQWGLALCGTREGLGSERRLTVGWFLKQQTGVGLFHINSLKQGSRPPEEPWHPHMCDCRHTHTDT